MPKVFPSCRAGNIGNCLFMTVLLLKQILISLKGGNLISVRRSTGEIKFHMSKQAEFCVFYSWLLKSLWAGYIIHTTEWPGHVTGMWRVAQPRFCWEVPKCWSLAEPMLTLRLAAIPCVQYSGTKAVRRHRPQNSTPTTRPVKMLVMERER